MKFLKQVADYYTGDPERRRDLGSYTFVFPNKRSAMHMRKYLKDSIDTIGFMPKLVTITSFTQEFSARPLGSPSELLFILYDCYRRVLARKGRADQARDFDTFIFWGNIALHDFSDVDAYMANPVELFRNLKGLKEIEASYLTPEQIEVAKILGDKRDYRNYLENFWQHVPTNDDESHAANKFLKLWELMGELYDEFNSELDRKGITYSGRQSREALSEIKSMGIEDFGGQRYAFIGFYVLSTARTLTLERLQQLGIADFFWDTASPMLSEQGCRAGDFILPLSRKLKTPADFDLEPIVSMPKADIYPTSSNVGQTKVAAHVLRQWASHDAVPGAPAPNPSSDIMPLPTTGIVLPSEKLLSPMLQSIPPMYFPINVAMKVPYSSTSFAALFLSILAMQERAHTSHGTVHYFYRDVIDVLTNPYAVLYDKKSSVALADKIRKERLYHVDSAEITASFPSLAPIFKSPGGKPSKEGTRRYLIDLISALGALPEADGTLLRAYADAVDEIFGLADTYRVTMTDHTYFFLIKKLLFALDLQLNGSPVWGLQVMGIPDARVLDYDNLVVLSLNERIFPRRNPALSLIPDSLRHGYGLPTADNEEVNNSYQFFRLISRAKRLALTYDSRTPDMSGGEISRYLLQLIDAYADKGGVEIHSTKFGMEVEDDRVITIKKVPEVMADLLRLKTPDGGLRFSASSLKTYLKCPLQFYLREVKKLNFDNPDPEYMDAASYGSIVHKVAERFYRLLSLQVKDPGGWIAPREIAARVADPHLDDFLNQMALEAMNEIYYFDKYTHRLQDIPGEGRVLARVIAKYVKAMLRSESEGREFRFVEAEYAGNQKGHTYRWPIDAEHTINFTMSIDRIDELRAPGKTLRFIDYKTGSDALDAENFDEIFTNHKCHAIFQLLLYSLAYAELEEDCGIMPMIYLFKNIAKGIPLITIEGREIFDYRTATVSGGPDGEQMPLREAFRERFAGIIHEIFDPDMPFYQTKEKENCRYCLFAPMCGRLTASE